MVVPYPTGDVVALRVSNGQPVWSESLARTRTASSLSAMSDAARPAITGGVVYAVGHAGRMVATSQKTGERLWSLTVASIQPPWVAGDSVFVVDTGGQVMAITRNDGKIQWATKLSGGGTWSGPVLAGNRLWLTSSKGQLASVEANSGKVAIDAGPGVADLHRAGGGGRAHVRADRQREAAGLQLNSGPIRGSAARLARSVAAEPMPPVIAIVGRPNVGKSTLFNRLTARRTALVSDMPGLTRDRREGEAVLAGHKVTVVDTAGLEEAAPGSIPARMRAQSEAAIGKADLVLFVLDARDGVMPADAAFAKAVRASGRPVVLVANKSEGRAGADGFYEAFQLGLGEPVAISAEHGEGIGELVDDRAGRAGLEAASPSAARIAKPTTRSAASRRTTRAARSGWPSSAAPTPASRRWSMRCSARSA